MSHWENVVKMVHTALQEGRMEEEAKWRLVLLIPKGTGTTVVYA